MEIQWLSNGIKGSVSIYETNITLNTVAASFFENAFAVLVGVNKKDETLIIKSLNKEEATSGVYNKTELHQISIKQSYGRINGKNIIRGICSVFPLNFEVQKLYKYNCFWDVASKSLIINLREDFV